MPGPGAYNGNYRTITRNTPRSIFGSALREKNTFYDTSGKHFPGPGAYNSSALIGKEGKNVTISPRRPDTSPQVGVGVPGPGAYD